MSTAKEVLVEISQQANRNSEELDAVYKHLSRDHKYTEDAILDEMRWFFTSLGLDAFYFETTPAEIIAQHIEALFAGKLLAKAGQEQVNQSWETIHNGQIMYACHDRHEVTNKIERQIDELYGNHRIRSYRSEGTTGPDSDTHFRLYFIIPTEAGGEDAVARSTNIEEIGDKNLLLTMSDDTKARYQEMVDRAALTLGPIIKFVDRPVRGSMNILVAYRRGSTHSYFSAIFDLLNAYGISSDRSYVEQFKNKIVLYSIHIPRSTHPEVLKTLQEDLSLVFVLPRTSLTPLFQRGELTAQEVIYAYAALKFACQFLTRYVEEYASLAPAFRDDPVRLGLLNQLKHRLSKDTFTHERVFETIVSYPKIVKELYLDFYENHFVPPGGRAPKPYDEQKGSELSARIAKLVHSQIDLSILEAFRTLNRHIQKTNFYRSSKMALSFRLDPAFLAQIDYPDLPFAIFLIIGSEFRGFHVRFRNIARGGVRIIRSGNRQAFMQNNDLLFHECYHLAHTQQRKNKDIAEGGSKGTILLSLEYQDRAEFAFKKYIDSLLDLMLQNEKTEDAAERTETLFLGPDEGTAEYMDWASHHSKHRGYAFWKSFTTGKSVENGGIPHDLYGMTTHSVHQYVLGILEKSGIREEEVEKLQTGGPDGDLGSNEIKISKDKTTSIVDGSGVLHDPAGLDRNQLSHLAGKRLPVSFFERSKLGKNGYLVTIEDREVVLPDGTEVESGFIFRNEYHLLDRSSADLFVPCGGRPNSVHINNVNRLFNAEGDPRFRFIVEGANLFFSQEARIVLEDAGVVVIKDSSANKGGVTSSSLEVLVALCLNDEEFHELMEVHGGRVPSFYQEYVSQVKDIIAENARLEFECMWREHQNTGTANTLLSDLISNKINALNDEILTSPISRNGILRETVLTKAIPKVLLTKVGLETIVDRVPQPYIQALFAAYLASHYVYEYGLSASETRFVDFLQRFS
jgi:glutamate dehydrogenase